MPVIIYSVLRLGLFALALVGLMLAGMGGWLLILVAALVAWAVSYALLGSRRDAAALWIAERRAADRPRFGAGVEADAAAEDAAAADAAGDGAGVVEPAVEPEPPGAQDG
jgi:hypothetical protein